MNLNQELHEALGYCWHEAQYNYAGEIINKIALSMNPDYKADPRLVIREMKKREDWYKFCEHMCDVAEAYPSFAGMGDFLKMFILDTSGKLAQLALDWLKGEGDGNHR